jgi:hypothetical protein
MSIKDKMMDSMMDSMLGKMTAEEKSAMMDKMMESFFSNMSNEEKKDMMKNMMPKMMGQMMGGGTSMMNMMGPMMSTMMGGGKNSNGEGFNPMEICRKMMMSSAQNNGPDSDTFAPPEIKALFEEWLEQIENEIIDFTKETNSIDPEKVASHLKISRNSAEYLISRLEQKKKS